MKIRTQAVNLFESVIIILFTIFLTILFFNSLTGGYALTRFKSLWGIPGDIGVLLFGSGIILASIWVFFTITSKCNDGRLSVLFFVLLTVMLVVHVILLINIQSFQSTDSLIMLDQADFFASHPGSALTKESYYAFYYEMFGNNNFLTLIYSLIIRILIFFHLEKSITVFLFGINTAAIIGGNIITYLIVKTAKGKRAAVNTFFLLLFNPLGYLNVFWIYSNAISIPLLMGIVYETLKCYKAETTRAVMGHGAFTGILGGLSYLIRPTSLIPLIAAAILGFLFFIKHPGKWKKCLQACVSCGITLFVTYLLLTAVTGRYYSEEVTNKNFPITHWLMMGSHGAGVNTTEDMNYTKSFEGKEEKKKANIEALLDHYSENGLSGTARLFINKAANSFSDGYSSMDYRLISDRFYSNVFRYIAGCKKDLFVIYSQCYRILTLFLLILFGVSLLSVKENNAMALCTMLTLLGGIIFYCLWEAKNVYSAPFVPAMLVGSANGLDMITDQKTNRGGHGKIRIFSGITVLLYILLCICSSGFMTRQSFPEREYSIRFAGSYMNIEQLKSDTWKQTFYVAKPFNRIHLFGYFSGEGKPESYSVTIMDDHERILRSIEVSEANIMESGLLCEFDTIEAQMNNSYIIVVSPSEVGERQFTFYQTNLIGDHLDFYQGELTISGEKQRQDAAMSVYEEKDSVYMSPFKYWLLAVIGGVLLTLAGRMYYRSN